MLVYDDHYYRNDNANANKQIHNASQYNQISIVNRLSDKETNSVESLLRLSNVNYLFNTNNFTCKLMQLEDEQQQHPTEGSVGVGVNSVSSSKSNDEAGNHQQYWQTSEPISLNVAYKPIVHIDIVKNDQRLQNKQLSEASSSASTNAKLELYDDTDITFKCAYQANPNDDSVKVVWKLDDNFHSECTFKIK
jgi:hypothetical protein